MIENVIIICVSVILIGIIGLCLCWFLKLSKERQKEIIIEWLLLAVVKAEKELGDGTGQLKLRFVYDLFIDKFRFISMLISFSQFSELVDQALDTMRDMLDSNKQIKDYVAK
ncbi:MAG: hypothetical protein IJ272_06910 [Clostridia bacterium]|nr:hypothetical protein [Clostridia bacterium]